MKKFLLGAAGLLFGLALIFSVAAPAQAAALTSAQVQAIVGLLQSFGADASIVANVQATLTGQGETSSSGGSSGSGTSGGGSQSDTHVCPQISRTLSQGASGSDVSDLQEYLGVSQTGYFGPVTAKAVASFQGSEGLAQVGIVGPQTRAAFAKRCGWGGGDSDNPKFSASPTSGAAPLSVTFVSNTAGTINFGDGTSGEQSCLQLQSYPSQTRCTSGHTYTSAGTYTATLTSVGACASGMCAQIANVTITVGNTTGGTMCTQDSMQCSDGSWVGRTGPNCTFACPTQTNTCPSPHPTTTCNGTWQQVQLGMYSTDPNACTIGWACVPDTTTSATFSAAPTSGAAPLGVTFSSNTAGTINFGDGTSGNVTAQACTNSYPNPSCSYGTTHTYTTAGTYHATITTAGSCSSGYCAQTASVTITVTGSGTTPPPATTSFSANPTSGWTPLAVQFSANTAGTIDFGDGTSGQMQSCAQLNSYPSQMHCTASHTYTSAGTYTAKLMTGDSGGCSASITDSRCLGAPASVQVVGTVTITVMTAWQ